MPPAVRSNADTLLRLLSDCGLSGPARTAHAAALFAAGVFALGRRRWEPAEIDEIWTRWCAMRETEQSLERLVRFGPDQPAPPSEDAPLPRRVATR